MDNKGVSQIMIKVEKGEEYAGLLEALRKELHGGPQIYSQSYSNLDNSMGNYNGFFNFKNQWE